MELRGREPCTRGLRWAPQPAGENTREPGREPLLLARPKCRSEIRRRGAPTHLFCKGRERGVRLPVAAVALAVSLGGERCPARRSQLLRRVANRDDGDGVHVLRKIEKPL